MVLGGAHLPGDGAAPAQGFTSAFYYDPNVEIRDFLEALRPGFAAPAAVGEKKSNVSEKPVDANPSVNVSETSEPAMAATSDDSGKDADRDPVDNIRPPEPRTASPTVASPLPTLAESQEHADDVPTHEPASLETFDSGIQRSTTTTNVGTPPREETVYDGHISDDSIRQSGIVEQLQPIESVVSDDTDSIHGAAMISCTSVVADPSAQTPSIAHQDQKANETSEHHATTLHTSKRSRPLNFAASLTASFAPETKSAWAQLFGSRYEDEVDRERSQLLASPESPQEKQGPSTNRTTLKSKIERERKLDKQIQASRQRFKDRPLHHEDGLTAGANSNTPPSPYHNRVTSMAPIASKPFEAAGLSITSVRFCVEKALRATCKCFHQLHALAMNEPRISKAEVELGVFISQWELERLLRDLFDVVRDESKSVMSSLSSFALADPLYAGVPLELLLQATWFVPFDQLSRLRSLVFQITRKHLNEHKLAALNRHLQKQLLLIPYSTRLQQVLLRFSSSLGKSADKPYVNEEDENAVVDPPSVGHCSAELVQELLECVGVPVSSDLVHSLDDGYFMLLSPFELFQRWRLSSLLCVQRLVYFRYLIEAITTERAGESALCASRKGETKKNVPRERVTQFAQSVQSRTRLRCATTSARSRAIDRVSKTKTARKKSKAAKSNTSDSSGCSDSEGSSGPSSKRLEAKTSSVAGTQGSTGSSVASNTTTNNNNNNGNDSNEDDSTVSSKPAAILDTKPSRTDLQRLHTLQNQLCASLKRLGEVMPWLLTKTSAGSPAIRATFLAASAFHQSLDVMIKSQLALDCDVMDKLEHFVEAIEAIINAQEVPRAAPRPKSRVLPHPAVAAATTVRWSRPSDSVDGVPEQEEFPPPFPDLTRDEEKALFPPPYESTGASYWAFTPDIPPPAVALEAQRLQNTTTTQPSPGVGTYDIQRSERVTFQQSAGHSFRKAGVVVGNQPSPRTPLPTSTPSKPHLYKSSLGRPMSPAVRAESPSLPQQERRMNADSGNDSSEIMQENREMRRSGSGVRVNQSTSAPELHDTDDDERLEVDIMNALRRQHSMVVSDFMQNIVLHHTELPVYSTDTKTSRERAPQRAPASATAAATVRSKWRSSNESRFVNRMRTSRTSPAVDSRLELPETQTTSTSSNTSRSNNSSGARPYSARNARGKSPPSPTKSGPPSLSSMGNRRRRTAANAKLPLPNGREPPTNEHLAWAARVGDLYRAQQSLTS